MADDKIKDSIDPSVENDPEVLAEVKKNRILHLKLERWKDTASTVGVILQTFKAEAMSLTSGVGTLVVGWFQIRRWVAKGRADVKAEGRVEGVAEGRIAGRAAERAERRQDRTGVAPATTTAHELVATSPTPDPSFFMDPMSYVTVILPLVFVWSSVLAWLKRKKKMADQGGRRDGD